MVLEISVHVGTNDINLVFVAGVGGVDCSTPATSHRNRVELGIVKTTQVCDLMLWLLLLVWLEFMDLRVVDKNIWRNLCNEESCVAQYVFLLQC